MLELRKVKAYDVPEYKREKRAKKWKFFLYPSYHNFWKVNYPNFLKEKKKLKRLKWNSVLPNKKWPTFEKDEI